MFCIHISRMKLVGSTCSSKHLCWKKGYIFLMCSCAASLSHSLLAARWHKEKAAALLGTEAKDIAK